MSPGGEIPYPLPQVDNKEEVERLDDMHIGITAYLGNKLTLAPLDCPRTILEVGSGTGSWAIQAAQQFPDAEVLAVDIAPLPPRTLPPNLKFQNVDLLVDPYPLQQEYYDVVHARLVLVWMPNAKEIIAKLAELVKPGGYLLLDDVDFLHNTPEAGPNTFKGEAIYAKFMESKGQDPHIGTKIEQYVKDTNQFSEVHAHKVAVPLNPIAPDADPAIASLGRTMKLSVIRATVREQPPDVVTMGFTKEIQKGWEEEIHDPVFKSKWDIFFTWSRKHV